MAVSDRAAQLAALQRTSHAAPKTPHQDLLREPRDWHSVDSAQPSWPQLKCPLIVDTVAFLALPQDLGRLCFFLSPSILRLVRLRLVVAALLQLPCVLLTGASLRVGQEEEEAKPYMPPSDPNVNSH